MIPAEIKKGIQVEFPLHGYIQIGFVHSSESTIELENGDHVLIDTAYGSQMWIPVKTCRVLS